VLVVALRSLQPVLLQWTLLLMARAGAGRLRVRRLCNDRCVCNLAFEHNFEAQQCSAITASFPLLTQQR
jgi:hypothetical protein